MNRGARPAAPANQAVNPGAAMPGPAPAQRPDKSKQNRLMPYAFVGLIFSVSLLIVALAIYLAIGNKGDAQARLVSKEKLQAVFLNGGQVYFGKIKDLNSQYLRLDNIYYLRVNQQVQPEGSAAANQDISLVKLGCELHGPQDSMVINQDQVIFWENLKDDGQVAAAVAKYIEENPNGQQCDTPSADSNATGNASQQPAATQPSTDELTNNP